MWVFAPWGQWILAQGKLVFERLFGIECREFLLPCQGNAVKDFSSGKTEE